MAKRLVALSAATAALILISGVFDVADARHGGGARGHGHHGGASVGPRSFHAPAARMPHKTGMQTFKGHRGAHRAHRRHFIAYGYAYYDACAWLRRNALQSGSRYWWSRYYACLDGYGTY
jgi:hypothetical protein